MQAYFGGAYGSGPPPTQASSTLYHSLSISVLVYLGMDDTRDEKGHESDHPPR